ncbi:2-dehydropantoate 2-reductase [Myxococcota bacterium]|nr:2-dehydropantoate 2-reductase [Myxococcota bacterium]
MARFLVIGLGPIGSLVGGRLARSGHQVHGVEHAPERARAAEEGLVLETPEGTFQARLATVDSSIPPALERGPFDAMFLCTKANEVATAARSLASAPGTGPVVCLQNGWEIEEPLVAALGPGRVVRGVVHFAGEMPGPGRVRQTFAHDPSWVGALDPRSRAVAEQVASWLTEAGMVTQATDRIDREVWRKTVHLCILAPLCALTRMNMREALGQREIRRLAQGLLTECIQVGDRLGYDCGNGFFEASMGYVLAAGDHPPSMLMDVIRGRPTEVSFLNGKVVEAADRLGMDVPLNRAITALLTAMESRWPRGSGPS